MSELAVENLIETGSIPEGKVTIEEAVEQLGKAATLAEWVYAGLRIETRDWSAELRKSSDVQLPKFALLENSVEQTGSIRAEAIEQKAADQKHIGASVGLSSVAENNFDQTLLGLRDAKVMGLEGFRLNLAQDVSPRVSSEAYASIKSSELKIVESPLVETVGVVETPVVEAVVAEPVAPETVVVAEQEMPVVVVIETPVVAEVVAEPVAPETVVVAEPEMPVVVVVETPVIEAVVAAPVAPETVVVAEPEMPVVVVIETPVIEAVVAEPATPETVVVAEPEMPVVVVIETPVVEAVVAEPATPETVVVAEPEMPVVGVVETPVVAEVVAEPVAPETVVVAEQEMPVVVVVETPVVEAVVAEPATPETVVVAEPETPVTVVVETPVVEAVVAAPVAPETVVVAEPEMPVVVVIETPVIEAVVAEPAAPETVVVAEPEMPVVVVVETPVIEAVVAAPVAPETVVVAEPEMPVVVVVETPVVAEVVAEPVAPETVVVAEQEMPVVVVVETPVIEAVVAEPTSPETVVVAEPEMPVVVVIETPVVAEVVAEPVAPETVVVAEPDTSVSVHTPRPESDLDFGRLYFHGFDSSDAKIVIKSDFFTSFDDLISHANLYQDEASTVFELDNGSDFIILTQFAMGDVSADMFVFEPANRGSETAQVFVRENEIVTQDAVAGDLFNFGLDSGRIYVTDFDVTSDKIFIKADLFSNFDEMMSRTTIYQDESSTVFELHDSVDMIIMPHFSIENIQKEMFVFEAQTASKNVSNSEIQFGTDHDDTLIFGAGDQMIDPGLGFDVVTGGEGHDTFIFGAHSGHDFIVDFRSGEDLIRISADLAHDFGDIMDKASIYQDGGATQIEFSGGQMITLFDTSAKTASAEWFSFA